MAANPNAARGVLSLYRAWRVAREDASGLALPSGRRILLPNEEARDVFHERGNYFAELESAAEGVARTLNATPAETNHAIAERLRREHHVSVRVAPMEDALRRYEPETRTLTLSEQLPRESRGFHMAFQVILLEARDMVEALLPRYRPHHAGGGVADTDRPAELRRGRAADALHPFLEAPGCCATTWTRWPRASASASSRPATGCPRCRRRARAACRSSSCGVDPAGNVSKRFSAGGFPFARYGGSCPRWVVHAAFATPGTLRVQVAQLTDGATFLCFARCIEGPAAAWGEPPPTHVIAMGCDVGHAGDIVYADGLNLDQARSASACLAGCATASTAAAAPFRRWSTGWRWTRIWRATARTVSSLWPNGEETLQPDKRAGPCDIHYESCINFKSARFRYQFLNFSSIL